MTFEKVGFSGKSVMGCEIRWFQLELCDAWWKRMGLIGNL